MANPRTDKGARKNPLLGQFPISERVPASRTSYCRIVVFHYERQNFKFASNVNPTESTTSVILKTERIIIEEEVSSLRISKSLSNPSGIFDATLFPTRNWKQIISPGDWVAIYLFSSMEVGKKSTSDLDTKNMVMLGNIDRVSRTIERNEDDDKIESRYKLSGRNFGKAFEDINVWFDPYSIQDAVLDVSLRTAGLEIVGNPTEQVQQILDVFLGPGSNFPGKGSTSPLRQFLIPTELSALFGVSKFAVGSDRPLLYDILNINIEPDLPGFRTRNNISARDNGNLWENLVGASNELINEMYLEEVRATDGTVSPTITLRPKPLNTPRFELQFGDEKDAVIGTLNGKVTTLQSLSKTSFIEIVQGEIISEDIGKDDHSRFNMYWLTSTRFEYYTRSIYADKRTNNSIGNPFVSQESIRRYGLKRFEKNLDFDRPGRSIKESQSETELFKAFMVQLYDQNFANHLYDGGTMETSGVLEAELGKTLNILPNAGLNAKSPVPPKKIYYIQAYEHEWNFPNTWRTTFTLTHGQYQDPPNIFIDVQPGDDGALDEEFDSTYIAKTETINK